MKPKTKTITQVGIVVSGETLIHMWGGGKGEITMRKTFIPNDKITKDNILRCVNDGGFGCESIERAFVIISIKYDNGSDEFDREFIVDHPLHTKLFLGWNELNKQGIKSY
jgi:hypothetical protein